MQKCELCFQSSSGVAMVKFGIGVCEASVYSVELRGGVVYEAAM